MDLGQADPMIVTSLTAITFENISGFLFNVYVIIIILLELHKRKHIKTGNKIRIAICISNALYSIVNLASMVYGLFWCQVLKTSPITYILYSLLMYSVSCCSWLSASLSFFYFIKVIHFNAGFFAWVKLKIGFFVPWVILVSEVVALGSFFIILLITAPEEFSSTPLIFHPVNITINTLMKKRFAQVIIAVTLVPSFTVIFSTIRTIAALKQHRLMMERNMGPAGNINLETYKSVICRMLRFLAFFAFFYSVLLLFYLSLFEELSLGFWICLIIMSSFSPAQAVLILFGNAKLKSAWRELVNCIFDSKNTDLSE